MPSCLIVPWLMIAVSIYLKHQFHFKISEFTDWFLCSLSISGSACNFERDFEIVWNEIHWKFVHLLCDDELQNMMYHSNLRRNPLLSFATITTYTTIWFWLWLLLLCLLHRLSSTFSPIARTASVVAIGFELEQWD